MPIIVLGMHRSGTSVVTSLLQGMGAYTGPPSRDIGASEENPKGFFEQRDVVDLNTSILAASGSEWHRVAHFDLSTLAADARRIFADEIDAIASELDSRSPWVLKDPRFCLTLPLWIERCPNAAVVFVRRSPLEVAESLRERNDFPQSVGIALWERYCGAALQACSETKAVFVSYRDLMEAPRATADRLRAELEAAGVTGLDGLAEHDLLERVDPKLRRNVSDPGIVDEFLNSRQLELWRSLERGNDAAVAQSAAAMSAGGQRALEEFEHELATVASGHSAAEPLRPGMSARYGRLEQQFHELAELQRRTSEKRHTAELAYRRAKARVADLERIVERSRERAEVAEESFRAARTKRDQAIDAFRREQARTQTSRCVDAEEPGIGVERLP